MGRNASAAGQEPRVDGQRADLGAVERRVDVKSRSFARTRFSCGVIGAPFRGG